MQLAVKRTGIHLLHFLMVAYNLRSCSLPISCLQFAILFTFYQLLTICVQQLQISHTWLAVVGKNNCMQLVNVCYITSYKLLILVQKFIKVGDNLFLVCQNLLIVGHRALFVGYKLLIIGYNHTYLSKLVKILFDVFGMQNSVS